MIQCLITGSLMMEWVTDVQATGGSLHPVEGALAGTSLILTVSLEIMFREPHIVLTATVRELAVFVHVALE